MVNKLKIARTTTLAVILAGLLIGFIRSRTTSDDPRFNGRSLSEWLTDLPWTMPSGVRVSAADSHTHHTVTVVGHFMPAIQLKNVGGSSESEQQKAFEAIRQIGTNALPRLVASLTAKDSHLKLWSVAIGSRLHLINPQFVSALQQQAQSLTALVALGSAAQPTVPELLKLAHDKSPDISQAAKHALNQIDPTSLTAAP